MKRIVILLFLFVMAFCAMPKVMMAQTVSGSFAELKGVTRVNAVLDFSEATIHGRSETEFSIYEGDWYKDKPEIVSLFLGAMQQSLKGSLALGSFEHVKYTLRIQVINVDPSGNYMCDVILLAGTDELGRISNITGNGGHIGTKLNLIKDGAEHTGANVGRKLRKLIKR